MINFHMGEIANIWYWLNSAISVGTVLVRFDRYAVVQKVRENDVIPRI